MGRKQVRLDAARVEAEAKAAEAKEAGMTTGTPPEADAVPAAPLIEPAPEPQAAPVAMPEAPEAETPPPAPKPALAPSAPSKRFRVTEDKRFSYRGMAMDWKAGRMLDGNGHDIAYLRSIGVKMVEV